MFALRSFLFFLFVGFCFPGYGFSDTRSSFEANKSYLDEVLEQDKNVVFFDTTLLHAEISLPPSNGPKLKGEDSLNLQKGHVSWTYVYEVPLLYLHASDNIGLKFSSFSIAYPFHSFP